MLYHYDLYKYESAERLRKATQKQLLQDAKREYPQHRQKR